MTTTFSPGTRMVEFTVEEAFEEIALLKDMKMEDTGSTMVYSGAHPSLGNVHIIIPLAGNILLLLPFAIQDF